MDNPAFEADAKDLHSIELNGHSEKSNNGLINGIHYESHTDLAEPVAAVDDDDRGGWGKSIEFLMSCIAMSVGLGNVWRFPFTALDNGGGAFLIPYLVVLAIIGRPLYYLEMVIGQFSSRNSINAFDLSPFFRGKFTKNISL